MEEATETPALSGIIDADVVIVGAGFTGLSAALHLAEAGQAVVVVESQKIGWGASGRNGGQVNPAFDVLPSGFGRTSAKSVATGFLSLLMGLVIWCSN